MDCFEQRANTSTHNGGKSTKAHNQIKIFVR
jgi:hypothetical protein